MPLSVLLSAGMLLQGCDRLGAAPTAAHVAPVDDRPIYTPERISFPKANLPNVQLPSGESRPVASVLNVTAAMTYGEFVWNEKDIPPGKIWILVDLAAQTMSVFRGRHEIGTAVTLHGVDNKPTPVGKFAILERRKDHHSNLYDAPMPFMLRLTNDGVAIHGSDVREGAGTHGCLGVPLEFGSHLFDAMRVSDEVVIMADARPVTAGAGKVS